MVIAFLVCGVSKGLVPVQGTSRLNWKSERSESWIGVLVVVCLVRFVINGFVPV